MVEVKGDLATFRFFRPGVRNVHLVGDFTNWQVTELKLASSGDGWWHAGLRLPPGTHRFRYLADGQWFTDFAAFGIEYGPFGPNSILHIREKSTVPTYEQRTYEMAA